MAEQRVRAIHDAVLAEHERFFQAHPVEECGCPVCAGDRIAFRWIQLIAAVVIGWLVLVLWLAR